MPETVKIVVLVYYIWSPLLNVINVVDVSSPSTLHVAGDATTKKVADHASVTTDIATVVEEILHDDGNNAVDFDVILDLTEGAVDEAIRHVMTKNDDGHAAGEEIVAITDENVVKHVSHTTIYRT